MLTDNENRPALALGFGLYAFLMGCMALISYLQSVGPATAALMAVVLWCLIVAVIVCGMVWLAGAPLIRAWHKEGSGPHQVLASLLFFPGSVAIGFAAVEGWCLESTWSYAVLFLMTGAAAVHQYVLVGREALWRSGARVFSHARLVD